MCARYTYVCILIQDFAFSPKLEVWFCNEVFCREKNQYIYKVYKTSNLSTALYISRAYDSKGRERKHEGNLRKKNNI